MATEAVLVLLVLASLSMVSCQKPDDCWNNYPCCDSWRAQGYCRSNTDFMALACPLACGYCRPNFRESSDGNCFNHFDACEHWSGTGSCTGVDRLFMEENCREACQKCSVSKSINCGTPPQKECYNDDPCCDLLQRENGCGDTGYLPSYCRRTCARCEDHINAYGDCIDFFPMCKAKARNGQCEARPKWMNENCRAACGKCGQSRDQGCQTLPPPDNCGENEECIIGESCDVDCKGNRLCSRNKRDASTTFVHWLSKRQVVPASLPPPPPGSCKCRCVDGYVRQQRDDKSRCVPRSSCVLYPPNQKCGPNEHCVQGTSCDTDCFNDQICPRSKRQKVARPPPPPDSCSCRCVSGHFRQLPGNLGSPCVQRSGCPVI